MDFATYDEAYAYAQGKADSTGMDYGLEGPPNDRYSKRLPPHMIRWRVALLPIHRKNRFGWELLCQVVRPTNPPEGYWDR